MIISGEDRYGRILATLYCEDRNANIYQLESGMAWVYDWLGIDVGGLYPFTHWIAFGGGAAITILGNLNKEEE